jgi:hypothetical protein
MKDIVMQKNIKFSLRHDGNWYTNNSLRTKIEELKIQSYDKEDPCYNQAEYVCILNIQCNKDNNN